MVKTILGVAVLGTLFAIGCATTQDPPEKKGNTTSHLEDGNEELPYSEDDDQTANVEDPGAQNGGGQDQNSGNTEVAGSGFVGCGGGAGVCSYIPCGLRGNAGSAAGCLGGATYCCGLRIGISSFQPKP